MHLPIPVGVGTGSPKCLQVSNDFWRLYFYSFSKEYYQISSAVSRDLVTWEMEPGFRLEQTGPSESFGIYSPDIIERNGQLYMFYAAWSQKPNMVGIIKVATSRDGLAWERLPGTDLTPAMLGKDYVHVSEPKFLDYLDRPMLVFEIADRDNRWKLAGVNCAFGNSLRNQ